MSGMRQHRMGWRATLALTGCVAATLIVPVASTAVAAAPATCDGLPATILGTERADKLTGTSGPDVIVGLGGNDRIRGADGDDIICGGAGDDDINGGDGDDRVFGEAGDDRLHGGDGDDMIDGGDGNDDIKGGDGDDVLLGATGSRNTLKAGGGDDACDPGGGGTTKQCESAPPVAVDDTATTDEDTPLVVDAPGVLANDTDPDSDPLTVSGVDDSATIGSVTVNPDGSFSYDPDGRFESLDTGETATDSFVYTATDGALADAATVTITIVGVTDNFAPVAVDDAFSTDEKTVISTGDVLADNGAGPDFDPDPGDTISVIAIDGDPTGIGNRVTLASGATVQLDGDGGLTYDPSGQYESLAPGETAVDGFEYTIADSSFGAADSADVTIVVTGVDDSPTAVDDAATVTEDDPATPVDVVANDVDVDGGPVAIESVTQGSNGTVFITGGGTGLEYRPDPGYCNGGSPTDDFTYTLAPGGSTATVAMSVTCLPDPPNANADAYDALGNVSITVPIGAGLAANDDAGDDAAIDVTPFAGATVAGGAVAVASDGSFSYVPPAGFEGVDTFTYTITGTTTGLQDTATATITVTDIVWFVDAAAPAGGDGRLATPLQSLTALTTSAADEGQPIFVADGEYPGTYSMLAGQSLIGDGSTGTLASVAGVGVPPFSSPLPGFSGNKPQLGSIVVAQDNLIRGLDIVAGSGTALLGTDADGLTVTEVDTVASGGGRALDIVNGAGVDIVIGAVSAASASGGVRLAENSGSVTLSGVAITTTGGTGVIASNAGTLTITGTGNAISSSGGPALDVQNTTIGSGGLNFEAVSSSGASNAIVLVNTGTAAGLTVSGAGGACGNVPGPTTCTGGTVSGSGDAISLTDTSDVSLSRMRIESAGRHGIFGLRVQDLTITNSEILNSGNAPDEDAVHLDTPGQANVIGVLAVADSLISGFRDTGIRMGSNSGTVVVEVTGSRIEDNHETPGSGGDGANAVDIEASGSATVTVDLTGNEFDEIEQSGIDLIASDPGASMDVDIDGNSFTDLGGSDDFPTSPGILLRLDDLGSMTFDVTANTITGNPGTGIELQGDGTWSGRIGGPSPTSGNVVDLATLGDGIRLDLTGEAPLGSFDATILVQNNTLTNLGDDGIQVLSRDNRGALDLTIEDNGIGTTGSEAIRFFTDEDLPGAGLGDPTNAVRIVDNSFSNIPALEEKIYVDSSDVASTCLHIAGNTGFDGAPADEIDLNVDATAALSITQPGLAALVTANPGAAVTADAGVTFNGSCTNPVLPTNP